ncbi:cupin domain-containing protein [Bradyrhizobium sp. UFLA05-153]
MSLSRLLYPMTVTDFRAEVLGRRALHTSSGLDALRDAPGWGAFDGWLASAIARGAARAARTGSVLGPEHYTTRTTGRRGGQLCAPDPSAIREAFEAGYSFIVNGIERHDLWIAEFARQIGQLCGGRVEANVYAAGPAGTEAFPMHWDDHDVMVLQLAGSKDWEIAPATLDAPLIGAPGEDVLAPALHERKTVARGDLLYLPRGWWHRAVARGEGSLHISFGIARPLRLDLLRALAEIALESAPLRADIALDATGQLSAADRNALRAAVNEALDDDRLDMLLAKTMDALHPPALCGLGSFIPEGDAWLCWQGPVPLPVLPSVDGVRVLLAGHEFALSANFGPALVALAQIGPRQRSALLAAMPVPREAAEALLDQLLKIGILARAYSADGG